MVPGDGKGLATVDLDRDGWPDLVATRNNGHALCFRNNQKTGGNSFGIELQGLKSNPRGIGSRIEIVLTNGKTQTAEVSAGGGYLSQSDTVCFFGFPDGNPPSKINVTWASGEISSQTWTSGQSMIRVHLNQQ